MIWKFFDMEQCHRFLHSWQNAEQVPCTKIKSSDTICFKTAWDNELVSYQWYFSAFTRPKIHSLVYQMPTLFSKEHVISGSQPDNLVCRWDPLDPLKKWPKWPRFSGSFNSLSTLIIINILIDAFCDIHKAVWSKWFSGHASFSGCS